MDHTKQPFQAVIEQTPIGLCITDSTGIFEYVNEAYCRIYGYAASELQGRHFTIVVPPEMHVLMQEKHDTFIREGEEINGEYEVVRKDGTRLHVESSAARLPGPDGRARKATFVTDVTARRTRVEHLRRLRAAVDTVSDAVSLTDMESLTFVDVNRAAIAMLGYFRHELLGMGPADVDPHLTTSSLRERHNDALRRGITTDRLETIVRHKNGHVIPVEMQIGFHSWGGHHLMITITRDISDRIRNENKLRRANEELDRLVSERTTALTRAHQQLQLVNAAVENSLDGITITARDGTIEQVNEAFTRVTGYSTGEAIGNTPRILKSGHHDKAFYQRLWLAITKTGHWEGEIWNRRKNGEVYPEWLMIRAIYDDTGSIVNFIAIFHDLSELRRREEEADFQASHDALTGLPNRPSFIARLDSAILEARRNGNGIAVVIADIDGFRQVNDSEGHTGGDKALQIVAQSLRHAVGERATLARTGGDEFGILISDISDQWDYLQIVDRIGGVSETPVTLDSSTIPLSLSLGVALFPDDAEEATTLLRNAEAALHQLKEEYHPPGRRRMQLFTPALNEALRRRSELETLMRQDLEAGRFVPYYQPRIDLKTEQIVGAEALARWIQEDGTVVSPAEFIPLAEDTELIIPLGTQLLTRILQDLEGPLRACCRDLTISFNVSTRELGDPAYSDRVSDLVNRYSGHDAVLEIELTESVLMSNIERSRIVLTRLKQLGMELAIDDFGTGYSSLSYLKQLPIDILKIDRSFVADIDKDTGDQAIVAAIIGMGHALGMRIVAEGIEKRAQQEYLAGRGCTEGQGYLYSPPVPAAEFAALVRTPA